MKKLEIVLISIVILLLSVLVLFYATRNSNFEKIKIGDKNFFVEIANTQEKREKGLSGRKKLEENTGMLFVFENSDYHSFWMKNVLIPLDFIWIREKKVVEITENIKPNDYQPPNVLTPKNKVDMVLEVNGGFVKKNKIKKGSWVRIDIKR